MESSSSPLPVTEIVINLQQFEQEEQKHQQHKHQKEKKSSSNSTTSNQNSKGSNERKSIGKEFPLQDVHTKRPDQDELPPLTVVVPVTLKGTADVVVEESASTRTDDDSVLVQMFVECFGLVTPPTNVNDPTSNSNSGKFMCIRHAHNPIASGLCTLSSSSKRVEPFRINICRYCYMDEKRYGIVTVDGSPSPSNNDRPKNPGSLFQLLQVVQMYATNKNPVSNDLTNNSDHSTTGSSIGDYTVSALFVQNCRIDSKSSGISIPEEISTTPKTSSKRSNTSLAFRILNSYRSNENSIMESSLKRIHQVQNFAIQMYKQQILDYQQMIIKLQYDLIQKDQESQATIKQLRRTIQQDCKVIKTMATQQQDVEYALGLSSQHQKAAPSTLNTIENDPLIKSMLLGGGSSHSLSTEASGSPLKPQQNVPTMKPLYRTRSALSQSIHQQQQQAEATILESGDEDETETTNNDDPEIMITMPQKLAVPTSIDVATDSQNYNDATATRRSSSSDVDCRNSTETTSRRNSTDGNSRGAILQLQQNWNRPKLRSGNNNDLGMKSSHEIFQSFRGGLLDIPRSPPQLVRHDNISFNTDDNDNKDPKQQRPKNNKKLTINSDMMNALQIPTRGLLSRSDSMVIPTNPNASGNDGMTPNGNSNYNHTLATLLAAKLQQEELDFRTNHGMNTTLDQMNSPPPLLNAGIKPTTSLAASQQQQQLLPSISLQSPIDSSQFNTTQAPLIRNINSLTTPTTDLTNSDPSSATKVITQQNNSTRGGGDEGGDDYFENDTDVEDDTDASNVEDYTSNDGAITKSDDNKFIFSVTGATCHDKFGDEGTYTGTILVTEGLPHGQGKMNYDSGRVFDGDWICGQWHGRGKLLNANGDSYDGEFFFDARHGHGVYRWDNGDIYVGNFTNDKRNGRGKFSFHNGNIYEGEFSDGLFDGYGKYNFAGGSYEGGWKDGRYNGSGVLTYGNTGGKYAGEFRNSVAHGFGIETTPDGQQRRGVWVDGKPTEYLE